VSQKREAADEAAQSFPPSSARSPAADFAINARVRQVLTRRWVRRDQLEIGTTEGVVVLKGQIEREPGTPETEDDAARERFLHRLRSELKAIPGVVDVVMDTDSTERTQAS
jgi:hypothetical protein